MRLYDALHIAGGGKLSRGYRVSFEKRENGILKSDHFPERNEEPLHTEQQAWTLAELFARLAPSEYVNIYVVDGGDWTPVPGYRDRMLRRH